MRTWDVFRALATASLLGAAACSGSISCGGCFALDPIPGGFDPNAQIERAAQIRVTQDGLDFIESEFPNLMSAYASLACNGVDAVPCPTGFVDLASGTPNPSSCDVAADACVEQLTGTPGPLIGFQIDLSSDGSAIVCRDDPNGPNPRACYAWLRFEDLALMPEAPNRAVATINTQIETNDIPFRYEPLGMDCVVSIDSGASGAPTQDIVATAEFSEWAAPSGVGGRQLDVSIVAVEATIPDDDVVISRDPVHGTVGDTLLCGVANLGVVKNALIPQFVGSLTDIVSEQIDLALGQRCGVSQPACPSLTSCNSDFYCEVDATGEIVPVALGLEGRLDLGTLLGGFLPGRPGQSDISFLVGGPSTADASGLTVGSLGGAEVVVLDTECAMPTVSPRLRPGFVAPAPVPTEGTVDLDFDGTPETDFMVMAAASEALLDQYIWAAYATGSFCAGISAYDIDILNTGTLSLLMPSLEQLTHVDRYRRAVYPAMVTIYPGSEPQVVLGRGRVTGTEMNPTLAEPLVSVLLDDLEIGFFAIIEDRWLQIMRARIDLSISFGAMVTPNNEILPVLGDIADDVTDIQILNSEILAETPGDLAMAIPALLEFALGTLSGAIPSVALPSAAELGGFELNVLGIRGVEQGGSIAHAAVYADLGFDPSQVPNLQLAADTTAELVELRYPPIERMSVAGGAVRPTAVIKLDALVPADAVGAEYQVRVDGGFWSPFFKTDVLELARAEFLIQGHHTVEVRARIPGQYRTLDATAAVLDILIDPEAPHLDVRISATGAGLLVSAWDDVSEHVRLELQIGDTLRSIDPGDDGFVPVPELTASAAVAVVATDEAGNVAREQVIEGVTPVGEPPSAKAPGCSHVSVSGPAPSRAILLLLCGLLLVGCRSQARRARSERRP